MECKNCELPLRTDYSYCSNCGAKVIRNRITLKNLWYDFTERFFNVDNTFFKTFKNLFTNPDDVIVGYINGRRKKYINPISYFTIALTLGGLFAYLTTEFFPDVFNLEFLYEHEDGTALTESEQVTLASQKKMNSYLFKYQSFVYVAFLPLLSLISVLVFYNYKKYNFSEHFVVNIYTYSHASIITNTLYIFFIWNSKILYYASTFSLIFQVGLYTWVFYKIFDLSRKQAFMKLLFFLLILGVVFFAIVIIGVIIAIFFTDTLEQVAMQ